MLPWLIFNLSPKGIVMWICVGQPPHRFCFWIPLLRIPWPFPGPPPENGFKIHWVDEKVLPAELQRELSAVATLHAAAAHLSADLKKPINAAIEGAMKTLQGKLPQGTTLEVR
jgi:hypothetical protein